MFSISVAAQYEDERLRRKVSGGMKTLYPESRVINQQVVRLEVEEEMRSPEEQTGDR